MYFYYPNTFNWGLWIAYNFLQIKLQWNLRRIRIWFAHFLVWNQLEQHQFYCKHWTPLKDHSTISPTTFPLLRRNFFLNKFPKSIHFYSALQFNGPNLQTIDMIWWMISLIQTTTWFQVFSYEFFGCAFGLFNLKLWIAQNVFLIFSQSNLSQRYQPQYYLLFCR